MNKTIDIIIDSLSDDEWSQLKLKVESRRAMQKSETFLRMKNEAIAFGDWILKYKLTPNQIAETESTWVRVNPETSMSEYYTNQELYRIYFLGEWDEE